MRKKITNLFYGFTVMVFLSVMSVESFAKGNMVARCKALDNQELGTDDAGFAVKVPSYKIETGQCYKLAIISSGKHEYILEGAEFFSHIYIRKLEIGKIELGVNSLRSIDFDDAVSVELYFLPVKPGTYEIKDKYLHDKGTAFSFVVE